MRENVRFLLLAILLIALFLNSCDMSTKSKTGTVDLEIQSSVTETSNADWMAVPTVIRTVAFTFFPSPTLTHTVEPSHTFSPSSTSIPTIAATLSNSQKEEHFRKAILGTDNCRWPCFGRIIPGKTSWDQAVQILDAFVEWEALEYGTAGSNRLKFWTFRFQHEEGWYNGYIGGDEQGVLRKIRISSDLKTNILSVSEVLKTYGQPSEIYLAPNPIALGDVGLLQMVIVYRKYNAILYYEWDEKQVGDTIEAYDASRTHRTLMAMSLIGEENFRWTSQEIASAVINYDYKPELIPLEILSKMTVEQFTQAFMDPNTTQTIVIPLSAVK